MVHHYIENPLLFYVNHMFYKGKWMNRIGWSMFPLQMTSKLGRSLKQKVPR